MYKFFSLSFLLISMIAFSQQYHFDYFIQEQSNRVKPDKQQWVNELFYDSLKQNKLFLRSENNKIIASIYDKKNNRSHVFRVDQLKGTLIFSYKHTNQFSPQKTTKDYDKENVINVERIDSLKFKISVFKNSKLKKKKISAIVQVEKSEFNYLNFHADYSRTEEINEKIKSFLNPKFNYKISSEQKTYHSSGYSFEESIKKIQKTDLSITVPEKIIIKEYNYWSEFND